MPSLIELENSRKVKIDQTMFLNQISSNQHHSEAINPSQINTVTVIKSCLCTSNTSSILICSSSSFCANCLNNNELYNDTNSASSSSIGSMGPVQTEPRNILTSSVIEPEQQQQQPITILATTSCSNSTRSRSSSGGGSSSNSSFNVASRNVMKETQSSNMAYKYQKVGKLTGKVTLIGSKKFSNKRAKRPLSAAVSNSASLSKSVDETASIKTTRAKRKGNKKRDYNSSQYLTPKSNSDQKL